MHDLGKELIRLNNSTVANAQENEKNESRPYFLGRLTEAKIEEERQKAFEKGIIIGIGKEIGRQMGEQIGKQISEQIAISIPIGEHKKAIKAAKNMLVRGVTPELIADYLELDIDTVRSLKL